MNPLQYCTTLHLDYHQTIGRKVLEALAKNALTSMDDMITVAAFFGLQATEVAEAIANRSSLGRMAQVA